MSDDPTTRISGTRKAAILMVLLGPEVAGPLLRSLPRDTVGRITREVSQLSEVPPEMAQSILEEYFVEAVRPETDRGGAAVARQLLASAEFPEQVQAELLEGEPGGAATGGVLGPLLEAPPETLAGVLAAEHPQTAALVLLNLAPAKAACVLRQLSDEQRSEALQRMCSLRQVRGEILEEVVSSLNAQLQDPQAEEELPQADGVQRTAEVLQAMPRCEVRNLLDEIEKSDPEQAKLLREMVNTFEMLELADDRGIQELLRMVETKSLALALKDEQGPLVDKFMDNLSERAAGMLRDEMEFLGTVRPQDREAAQQEIIQAALQLEQDEKLTFRESVEEAS